MKVVTAILGDPSERKTPRFIEWLTHSKSAAPLWLAARVWLGVMWLQAGVAKLWGAENPAFMHNNGAGVAGFAGHGIASYSWWGSFLHSFVVPNASWIAVFIAFAEFLAGIGLVLGFFTPAAAFGALVLNMTYMFTGTAGVNPMYAMFSVILLATWRTSGWIGVDGLIQGFHARGHSLRHLLRREERDVAGIVQHPRAA